MKSRCGRHAGRPCTAVPHTEAGFGPPDRTLWTFRASHRLPPPLPGRHGPRAPWLGRADHASHPMSSPPYRLHSSPEATAHTATCLWIDVREPPSQALAGYKRKEPPPLRGTTRAPPPAHGCHRRRAPAPLVFPAAQPSRHLPKGPVKLPEPHIARLGRHLADAPTCSGECNAVSRYPLPRRCLTPNSGPKSVACDSLAPLLPFPDPLWRDPHRNRSDCAAPWSRGRHCKASEPSQGFCAKPKVWLWAFKSSRGLGVIRIFTTFCVSAELVKLIKNRRKIKK
jgi:hypothetical protein